METKIKELTIINAVRYGGKANEGSVLGMLLSQNPELKSKIQELKEEIKEEVKKINKLSLKQQEALLKKLDPKEFKKEEPHIKKGLPELKNVPKKPVFRLAPSPSGPLHIGHAIGLLLNSEYAKKYKGKFILRIEDTNPENIMPEAYKMIEDEVKWLTNDQNLKPQIQSDNLSLYYEKAEQLIKLNKAYVCTCPQLNFKPLVDKSKSCPCRNLKIEENQKRWLKMFKEKEGFAVLRIKTDLNHPNPAIRDWPAFRIIGTEHPIRKKEFRVWPLMNFAVAIDDYESGINYVIKGKDHIVNTERQ
jgi:glutamyl-tRNA synthetase